MSDAGGEAERHHREEVGAAYRAAARLGLYAAWAGAFGIVLAVGVAGAMLIGWMSASDGLTWLGFALLTALVSAAKFYSDAARTTLNAAGLERSMGADTDLYSGTAEYRRRTHRLTAGGVALALLATGTVAIYSIVNADTRTTHDDDDDTEEVDDDRDENDQNENDQGGNDGDRGDDGDNDGDD
jgi:hypothetical protein